MWEAIVAGATGLLGVALGQSMSRSAAREAHYLQLEEARRLELRRVLTRLLVDVGKQLDEAWVLLPMFAKFQPSDHSAFVETDTGRAMGERRRRIEEDVVALALSLPDGPLREALARLESAALRDWAEKAVGPVTERRPPADGRDRLEVAFEHVRACAAALRDVQREAALRLAAAPARPQALPRRLRRRGHPSSRHPS